MRGFEYRKGISCEFRFWKDIVDNRLKGDVDVDVVVDYWGCDIEILNEVEVDGYEWCHCGSDIDRILIDYSEHCMTLIVPSADVTYRSAQSIG